MPRQELFFQDNIPTLLYASSQILNKRQDLTQHQLCSEDCICLNIPSRNIANLRLKNPVNPTTYPKVSICPSMSDHTTKISNNQPYGRSDS